jgi:hypothetical protein
MNRLNLSIHTLRAKRGIDEEPRKHIEHYVEGTVLYRKPKGTINFVGLGTTLTGVHGQGFAKDIFLRVLL